MNKDRALSIDEINQLQGNYDKVVVQNQNLQGELNKYRQDLEEISAGVLMLAQILNIDVPKDIENTDLISEIAAHLEDQKDYIAEMEEQ